MKRLNLKLVELTEILADGEYHDGDALGEKLNVTRSAIWKMMSKLKAYGVKIESVKGKGYICEDDTRLLNANKISENIPQANIEIFETIPSTNQYLQTKNAKKTMQVCLAEEQTQGRGRMGRTWYSPFAKNIYLSCLCHLEKDLTELGGLSLVVSISICKMLMKLIPGYEFKIKWPNDIWYQQQKLGGVLIDVQAESHSSCRVIIGIGLNVNMPKSTNVIEKPYTSLQEITGKNWDRNLIVQAFIQQLMSDLQLFSKNNFGSFMHDWERFDGLAAQEVEISNLDNKIVGEAKGVNEQGQLLLLLKDGNLRRFSAGEATFHKH